MNPTKAMQTAEMLANLKSLAATEREIVVSRGSRQMLRSPLEIE